MKWAEERRARFITPLHLALFFMPMIGRWRFQCSNTRTAGFGSLADTTTNLLGDTTETMALLPPTLPVKVPLSLVGVDEME
jgi:hypothetical protein